MSTQSAVSTYTDYDKYPVRHSKPRRDTWVRKPTPVSVGSDKLLRDAAIMDQMNQAMEHNCGDDECLNCGGLMSVPYSSTSGSGQKHCLSCNHTVYI